MSKLDQLKALGDAKRAARKSSDGGVESRHALRKAVSKAPIGITDSGTPPTSRGQRSGAVGVAPGPSETKQRKRLPKYLPEGVTMGPPLPVAVTASMLLGETKLKRGRPRIGEVRDKPWLKCVPPMSKSTWYRRQEEARRKKEQEQ